jgi:P pilus assembly chaperone PapD
MFGFVFLSNIPESIFVNDTGEILVLDHVEATIVKCDKNSISLKVTNPTPYDAQVSVLSENGAQAKAPPGMYSYLNRKKIEVKSGQTAIFVISN